jgi:hypothetical protein
MSSAGGRGENKNRFNGTWKIEDNNGNTSDLDQIWIYEQNNPQTATYKELISGVEISTNEYTYTWERIKKGQGDEKTVWKGNYVYLNNTVFLSRLTIDDFKYEEENYGILMFKNDFGDNKFKLFSYRIDDEVDDENIKYVSSGYNSDFNTKDAKGGDGEFYNDIVCLSKGAIGYYVGKGERRPAFPDSPGGDTSFQNINKTLNGGIIPKNNDFGGRGGSFVYDYWGRIKYNESWPEDGKFLITYLGAANSVYNNITIETDSNIIKVSCPA